ncbi:IS66-like element accessory protein TnpA [Humitalea sp. 24SJ18S-53]|uniref:IS66-like element accessory protein TnpA n=1 Tax=Humitalea sp. 24SJ18S-53 TaxID=3422307 RepID=UPI003D679C27
MEIISGIERRRRWRVADKLRIVAEAERPGACFVEVARRHEVSRSVLWAWRKQARQGVLVAEPAPMFMPLQVATDLPAPVPRAYAAPVASPAPCEATAGRIEIALPDGTVIRVDEAIGSAALRRVVAALRG